MEKELKNGKVDWKTFILILGIGTTILGVLWNSQIKIQIDIVDVRERVTRTETKLDALISGIKGGEITLKINGGER